MGGLQRLLLRITPIIMLICFVCLGITHTFQQLNTPNITYLTSETITLDNNQTEATNDDIVIENYNFDFQSYRENIDQDILKRSVTKTINIEAYNATLNGFNKIWENGYNPGDILATIGNGVLLVVNTIIMPINILLVPVRVISGIILTGLSILGININNGRFITPMLTFIVDQFAIPYIGKTASKQVFYNGTTWVWDKIDNIQYDETIVVYVNFHDSNNPARQFVGYQFYKDNNGYRILGYIYEEDGQTHGQNVWTNGSWVYSFARTITIDTGQEVSTNYIDNLEYTLTNYATRIQ